MGHSVDSDLTGVPFKVLMDVDPMEGELCLDDGLGPHDAIIAEASYVKLQWARSPPKNSGQSDACPTATKAAGDQVGAGLLALVGMGVASLEGALSTRLCRSSI